MTVGRRIEKLRPEHPVRAFDCGQPDLNTWLLRFALQAQAAHSAVTYLGLEGERIVGFFSLAAAAVAQAEAPERLAKGQAKQPIPVVLLARLAVHTEWQGRGVGRGLLREAILRTLEAAGIIGARALVVHAKDDPARAFYLRYGFQPSPTDPYHLVALLKDLKASL